MKHVKTLAGLVSLIGVGTMALLAQGDTSAQAYADSLAGRTGIPVPVTVVSPRVDPSWVGENAQVEFLVGASGEPQNVRLQYTTSDRLGREVCDAVSQWRFEPAKSNGAVVPMKVVLPVVVGP